VPLKRNCGLSQKVGDANYGSHGASVNIEVELDSGLIAEPVKLQERIRQVFCQLRASLAQELNGRNGHPANSTKSSESPSGTGQIGSTSIGNGSQQKPSRPATQSQVKAIISIAGKQQIDLKSYLQHHCGVQYPKDLDITTASQVIDALKSGGTDRRAA
jgi:hypothetical protein